MDLKIEIVHDVVCSWCPIGYANLTNALKAFEPRINADIRFLPFELNPGMAPKGENLQEHLQRRNVWSLEKLQQYQKYVVQRANEAGLVYDYSKRTHYYNTSLALRLIDAAEALGQQRAVMELLTSGYFTHGRNPRDIDWLLEVAKAAGLTPSAIEPVLRSDRPSEALLAKYSGVARLGVRSIPFILVNGTTKVQGSSSVAEFTDLLQKFLDFAEAQPAQ